MNVSRHFFPLATITLALSGCASIGQEPSAAGPDVRPSQTVRHGVGVDRLYSTGRYLQGMARLPQAAEAYRQVLAINPNHVDALNALGVVHAMQGEAEQAEQMFRRALDKAPGAAHVLNNLGYHLMAQGRNDDALAVLQRAATVEPLNAMVSANMASLRERMAASPAPDVVVALPVTPAQPAAAAVTAEPVVEAVAVPQPVPVLALDQLSEHVWELRAPAILPGMATAQAQAARVAPPVAAASQRVEVFPRSVAAQPLPRPANPVALAQVEIANGNGRSGLAQWVAGLLGAAPQARPRLTNDKPYGVAVSRIEYVSGAEQTARDINSTLPVALPTTRVTKLERDMRVRVLLGKDFPRNAAPVSADAQASVQQLAAAPLATH